MAKHCYPFSPLSHNVTIRFATHCRCTKMELSFSYIYIYVTVGQYCGSWCGPTCTMFGVLYSFCQLLTRPDAATLSSLLSGCVATGPGAPGTCHHNTNKGIHTEPSTARPVPLNICSINAFRALLVTVFKASIRLPSTQLCVWQPNCCCLCCCPYQKAVRCEMQTGVEVLIGRQCGPVAPYCIWQMLLSYPSPQSWIDWIGRG